MGPLNGTFFLRVYIHQTNENFFHLCVCVVGKTPHEWHKKLPEYRLDEKCLSFALHSCHTRRPQVSLRDILDVFKAMSFAQP